VGKQTRLRVELALACGLTLGVACLSSPAAEDSARGEALFAQHCAVCHGLEGGGDGQSAPILFPPARDFGTGRFLLVSTDNGVPSDADLVRVLRRGMPGSAMPGFAWMPEADLRALAGHVRELAVQGLAEKLRTDPSLRSERVEPREALAVAREWMSAGAALAEVPPAEPSTGVMDRGRELYVADCGQCHGPDGRGSDAPTYAEDGSVRWARDFTAGILKGGGQPEELAWRVRAGMPGSAMPAFDYGPEDTAAVVAYVGSLIPAGTEERYVLRGDRIGAARVERVPTEARAADWSRAEEVRVVLAPTWWRDDAVFECTVSALHDGRNVALRLRWPDATLDAAGELDTPGDGAAVQLSGAPAPPLFGMGSHEQPTNIWHWRELSRSAEPGFLDLVEHGLRHVPEGEAVPDVPFYVPYSTEPRRESAESIEGRGPAAVGERDERVFDIDVSSAWVDGVWEIVFVRSLRARVGRELELVPGRTVQLACAIWNGSAENQGGRKSISVWQRFELAE